MSTRGKFIERISPTVVTVLGTVNLEAAQGELLS
jgi:hypothetical protein